MLHMIWYRNKYFCDKESVTEKTKIKLTFVITVRQYLQPDQTHFEPPLFLKLLQLRSLKF